MKETRQCQNCKNQFAIEPEDFAFYERIEVPPPTFCPECRLIRRMSWRNERSLYKRGCKAAEHREEIVSAFSSEKPFKIYDQRYWWGDEWDPEAWGQEYDFSKPFFQQFRELSERVPILAVINGNAVNTEYANHALDSKNSYLITAAWHNENILYSNRIINNRDSLDLYLADSNELCYENANVGPCARVFFSYGCEDCNNSAFLYDCRNCSNCLGCVGLRNKSYHIFNKPYSKEEYQNEIKKFNLGSYRVVQDLKTKHKELILNFPHKYMYSFQIQNIVGDIVGESRNSHQCFDSIHIENCKYVTWNGDRLTDTYDSYGTGQAELLYEVVDSGLGVSQKFTVVLWGGHDVEYCYNCHSSDYLFGCVSLRNKKYCILNKQYSEEEYKILVTKIKKHMDEMPYIDKKGRMYRYGEFFPTELSPFAYNETIAQEYFPLTKEKALSKGYTWKDQETRNYEITLKPEDLSDHISEIGDDVLAQVIGCAHEDKCNEQCTTAFKIISQELQFYRQMNLPLPRLCPNCRHYQRLKQRNPLKLWHRKCMKSGCTNEFETSYAPDRPEIIYCERCYQQEVY